MYSYGIQPYSDMSGQEAVAHIQKGHRLLRPEKADIDVYSWMTCCWEHQPENRPSFSQLFEFFSENPEYLNLKELLKFQDFQQLGM